jgi:hypothetical protein
VIGACSGRPVFQKGRRTVTLVGDCLGAAYSSDRERAFRNIVSSLAACRRILMTVRRISMGRPRASTHVGVLHSVRARTDNPRRTLTPNLGSVRSVTILARGVWRSEQ